MEKKKRLPDQIWFNNNVAVSVSACFIIYKLENYAPH